MNDESHAEQVAPSEAEPVAAAQPTPDDDRSVVHLGLLRIASRMPDITPDSVSVEIYTNALIDAGMLPESKAPKNRAVWSAAAREACARWQKQCQVVIPDGTEGTPDWVSTTRLGRVSGFTVAD